MNTEDQERTENLVPAPVPCPGDFEVWLDKQQDRQDETGAVARWIIEDLIKGCWPCSITLWVYYQRSHEERWRYWRKHLMRGHRFLASMSAFEAASAEYVAIEQSFMEWWIGECRRQEAELRKLGVRPFAPILPGFAESVEESKRFWARIEKEQESRKES